MNDNRFPLYVTTLIAGAFLMKNLDGIIIATSLPHMARSFHVGAVSLNLGVTAYLLTLAVFIPISGWVADRFGSRSVFATAIAVFRSGLFTLRRIAYAHSVYADAHSARCRRSDDGAGRPSHRSAYGAPKAQLTQAIAYISWPGPTALIIGPPIGGFITTYASWHWISSSI
jgi:MFS family permease